MLSHKSRDQRLNDEIALEPIKVDTPSPKSGHLLSVADAYAMLGFGENPIPPLTTL
jgi:hypothetical protein